MEVTGLPRVCVALFSRISGRVQGVEVTALPRVCVALFSRISGGVPTGGPTCRVAGLRAPRAAPRTGGGSRPRRRGATQAEPPPQRRGGRPASGMWRRPGCDRVPGPWCLTRGGATAPGGRGTRHDPGPEAGAAGAMWGCGARRARARRPSGGSRRGRHRGPGAGAARARAERRRRRDPAGRPGAHPIRSWLCVHGQVISASNPGSRGAK